MIKVSKKDLTIIQMNDTHGYLEEHWEHFYDGEEGKYIRAGGYPRIATYLKTVRKEKKDQVLFLDGGDTFHGTYPVVQTKGEILIPLLNDLGIDAMTAHWDFAYGPKRFYEILHDLNYPMLAINCFNKETDELVFPPYLIKEVNGLKIGIIGIAATIIDKTMPKHFSEGIYFTMGNEELPAYIKELKEEKDVDLVLVLSHLGFPQEVKLASEVNGIDILLSAHTHNRIYDPVEVNGTIIIQSGCHGSFLGHLDLTIENKKVSDYSHSFVVLDESIKEDPHMKDKVNKAMEPYREKLDQVWGQTLTDLNRYEVLEATMDNFLLQALMEYTHADAAFSNGWRYGAPVPKGPVTENDLWNIIPVNPPLSTVKITGKEIWDMLEENIERTFAKDPYEQMGGYLKRSNGINMYFKFENPFGERIQQLFVQGEEVDLEKIYNVVYVTTQGVPEKYGHDRKDLDIHAIEVLQQYLSKYDGVNADIKGNIKAV